MSMTAGLDLDAILALAGAQLWQVSLAALVLGAIARLAGRRRPRVAYALWMLVLVKALVPPVVSSPTGVFSWALAGPATSDAADRPATAPPVLLRGPEGVGPELSGGEEPRPRGPADSAPSRLGERLPIILGLLWLTGLSAGVLMLAAACIAGARRIGRTSRAADADLAERLALLARRLGVTRPVRLLVTESPLGPAAFGVLRPTVLLPAPLLRDLGPDQLDLVLAHELVHIRRGDVLTGHLQLLVRLLWWFHPLVWWAGREASRLRELCCDEEVVSALACPPARYARGLLEVLDRKRQLRPLFSVPGMRPIEITSHRLEHIMRYRDDHRRRTSLVCRLVFALGAILIIPGAGWVPQEPKPPAKERDELGTVFRKADREERARPPREWQVAVQKAGSSTEFIRQMNYDEWVALNRSAPAQSPQAAPPAGKNATKPADEGDDDRLELQIAKDRLKWAEDMHRKGYVSDGQVAGERSKLESIKIRQAEGRVKRAEEMHRKGMASGAQVDRERDALLELEASRAAIDLARAKDRLDWAEKMFAKGYVSRGQVESERIGYRKAQFELEQKRQTLEVTRLRHGNDGKRVSSAHGQIGEEGHARPHADGALAATAATVTLRGAVSDKATRRPLAGILVRVNIPGNDQQSARTDRDGHYAFSDVPARGPLILTALCTGGEPYLITSRVLEMDKGEVASADLDLFRGIPFRIAVLDATDGKPIRGRLMYFPVYPNDPHRWGSPGYVPAPGTISGALYDTVRDRDGWYRGAVLPGPGVLCFEAAEGEWTWKKGERETAMFFPDGLGAAEVERSVGGEPFVAIPAPGEGVRGRAMLMLGSFPAVVAINPKEATRAIVHEIRIKPR
jgi:beta-lactamase regulating signal transducer with metallopeptidase domain